MNSTKHFIEEMIGRILLISFCILSVSRRWWLPLIIAPVFWQLWDRTTARGPRILQSILKLIADGITHLLWLTYIGYSIVAFGLNIGHWYGWSLGVIVGLIVAHIFGLLWPHRWHLEVVDGNL